MFKSVLFLILATISCTVFGASQIGVGSEEPIPASDVQCLLVHHHVKFILLSVSSYGNVFNKTLEAAKEYEKVGAKLLLLVDFGEEYVTEKNVTEQFHDIASTIHAFGLNPSQIYLTLSSNFGANSSEKYDTMMKLRDYSRINFGFPIGIFASGITYQFWMGETDLSQKNIGLLFDSSTNKFAPFGGFTRPTTTILPSENYDCKVGVFVNGMTLKVILE